MGIRNYLIEGGSGVGKTTVAEELERRGYHVVHGDRTLAYYGNPETGVAMQTPHFEEDAARLKWGCEHWIWPVEQVKALIAERTNPTTFFCGHSENSGHFIGLFDEVFVLDVDAGTLSTRLAGRPEDEFGGRPVERDLVLRLHETKEGLPVVAVSIDSNRPVARVVDEIVSICGAGRAEI